MSDPPHWLSYTFNIPNSTQPNPTLPYTIVENMINEEASRLQRQGTNVGRPEHIHYKTVERFVLEGMEQKKDFFFDKNAFDKTLRYLELEYEFPYEVFTYICA